MVVSIEFMKRSVAAVFRRERSGFLSRFASALGLVQDARFPFVFLIIFTMLSDRSCGRDLRENKIKSENKWKHENRELTEM